jgi:hypothetical protein
LRLILNVEDVVESTFKTIRPEMRSVRGVDELADDAHAATGTAHAAR